MRGATRTACATAKSLGKVRNWRRRASEEANGESAEPCHVDHADTVHVIKEDWPRRHISFAVYR